MASLDGLELRGELLWHWLVTKFTATKLIVDGIPDRPFVVGSGWRTGLICAV